MSSNCNRPNPFLLMTLYVDLSFLFRYSGIIVSTGNNLFALTAAIFYSEGFHMQKAKNEYLMFPCQLSIQTLSTQQYARTEVTMQPLLLW